MLQVLKMRSPIKHSYQLKGQQLEEVDTSKYLDVDLSSNLQWKDHTDRTVKKANSTLGFLRGNLRVRNRDIKSVASITLVRPHLATVHLSGTFIQLSQRTKLKWSREEQPGTVMADTKIVEV